jgi:hypothetical protein
VCSLVAVLVRWSRSDAQRAINTLSTHPTERSPAVSGAELRRAALAGIPTIALLRVRRPSPLRWRRPVTRESGKHRAVTFRWACNMHLRNALNTLADTTRHTNPWARSIYQRARDRGHEHAHAIRILARAWCRVIWTCWQRRVPYDPTKHRAAMPFNLRLVDQEAA